MRSKQGLLPLYQVPNFAAVVFVSVMAYTETNTLSVMAYTETNTLSMHFHDCLSGSFDAFPYNLHG